jgi:multiple sugar transport system ATP-binding protein
MAPVQYADATRTYPGADRPAVDSLNLTTEDGEFLVLIGPSGCGKTTSLRMIAGLEEVDSGSVHIGDEDVTHLAPKDRDVAMVFQNYALYPHMTVAENLGFALKMAHVDKEDRRARVEEVAKMLELEAQLERKPRALSGGQRQRVAMGRAIIRQPKVFLMDEPLSNLDAQLRVQTRTQIAALQRRLGVTTIYVTHDQVEAMTMGDRVAVMFDGKLQQADTPKQLYQRPANTMVARFIGSPAMNLRQVDVVDGHADLGGYLIPLPRQQAQYFRRIVVGFRPDAVEVIGDGRDDDAGGLRLRVQIVEELGSDAYMMASFLDHEGVFDLVDVVARIDPRSVPAKGSEVTVRVRPGELHLFSPDTGDRLN